MKLTITAQLPDKDGGLEGKALFINTEGTFSAERVYQIAKARAGIYNSDHQVLAVDIAFKLCQDENVKLLVVDSVLSHFRSEYVGRETLAERQQKLNSHLHKLTRLAQAVNLRKLNKDCDYLDISYLLSGGWFFREP